MGRLKAVGSLISGQAPMLRQPPKVAESFYQSAEWRALVRSIKRQRGAWCERCGSGDRVIADHIVERKDGGADLDPSNIELLCHAHHARKTAEARAKRAHGLRG